MILGASHLTYSSAEPAEARRLLQRAGLTLDFDQRGVPNSPEKAPFLSPSARSAETMDITYFKGALGPAVELVAYPAAGPATGRGFSPLFALDLPASLSADPGFWESAPREAFPAAKTAAPAEQGIAAIACPVDAVDASLSFWKAGLGFSETARGASGERGAWVALELPALLPQWRLRLVLFEDSRAFASEDRTPTLDGLGFRCLSLLSSELEKDLARLNQAGAAGRIDPFELTVNGKRLRAGMVRGPGLELVELIQVSR